MSGYQWRKRLADAVADSGKSHRAVSIAAGCNPGYVHGILKEGKEPTIERLVKICSEIGVSVSYIVLGIDLSVAQERLLLLLSEIPDDQKKLLLELAESLARGNGRTEE